MIIMLKLTAIFAIFLVGYAAASCNVGGFQAKCSKYSALMAGQQSGGIDLDKMCCIMNEQVNCIDVLGCKELMNEAYTTGKAQATRMCGSYTYVKGCANAYMAVGPVESGPVEASHVPGGKKQLDGNKQVECLKTVQDDIASCKSRLDAKLKQYKKKAGNGDMTQDQAKVNSCKEITAAPNCAYTQAAKKCGKDGGNFAKAGTTQALADLREEHCSEAPTPESGCNGLSKINILLLLCALIFSKYLK